MKKFYLIILALVLMLVIAGCSEEGSENGANASNDGSDFPTRDIELVVGFGAGGGTDVFARAMGKELSEILDVNVNVVNQEGASGVVGGEYVASQPADGYTIWAISSFPVTTAAGANKNGLDVMKPIARIQSDTFTFQVKKDNGKFESIDELVEYAKENPTEVRLGGTGSLGMDEITAKRIMEEIGIEMNYVPFENAGQMHAALLGGHIDVILEEIAPTIAQIEAGEIIPIVLFSEEKAEAFPELPTAAEKGWTIFDGIERGFVMKRDTPDEVFEKIESAVKQAAETETYKNYETESYLDLRDGWLGSSDYEARLESSIADYADVLSSMQ